MNLLNRNRVDYILIEECDKAFNKMNESITQRPILQLLDWNNEFHLHNDASKVTIGIVLAQVNQHDWSNDIFF